MLGCSGSPCDRDRARIVREVATGERDVALVMGKVAKREKSSETAYIEDCWWDQKVAAAKGCALRFCSTLWKFDS